MDMPNELAIAFAQSLRWIIAGVAGAAFAKHEILDKNIWYMVGYLGLLILLLSLVEYVIQTLVLGP